MDPINTAVVLTDKAHVKPDKIHQQRVRISGFYGYHPLRTGIAYWYRGHYLYSKAGTPIEPQPFGTKGRIVLVGSIKETSPPFNPYDKNLLNEKSVDALGKAAMALAVEKQLEAEKLAAEKNESPDDATEAGASLTNQHQENMGPHGRDVAVHNHLNYGFGPLVGNNDVQVHSTRDIHEAQYLQPINTDFRGELHQRPVNIGIQVQQPDHVPEHVVPNHRGSEYKREYLFVLQKDMIDIVIEAHRTAKANKSVSFLVPPNPVIQDHYHSGDVHSLNVPQYRIPHDQSRFLAASAPGSRLMSRAPSVIPSPDLSRIPSPMNAPEALKPYFPMSAPASQPGSWATSPLGSHAPTPFDSRVPSPAPIGSVQGTESLFDTGPRGQFFSASVPGSRFTSRPATPQASRPASAFQTPSLTRQSSLPIPGTGPRSRSVSPLQRSVTSPLPPHTVSPLPSRTSSPFGPEPKPNLRPRLGSLLDGKILKDAANWSQFGVIGEEAAKGAIPKCMIHGENCDGETVTHPHLTEQVRKGIGFRDLYPTIEAGGRTMVDWARLLEEERAARDK